MIKIIRQTHFNKYQKRGLIMAVYVVVTTNKQTHWYVGIDSVHSDYDTAIARAVYIITHSDYMTASVEMHDIDGDV